MNTQKYVGASAVLLMCSLAACFGGGGSSVADATLTQAQFDKMLRTSSLYTALNSTVTAQAQTITDLQSKLQKLAIIGKPAGITTASHASARTFAVVTNAVSFGPCPDMGVKVGGSFIQDALSENYQAFKQTAASGCPGVYAEYSVSTGQLKQSHELLFDGPACTGNMYIDTSGAGYDRQKLSAGIAFLSPIDNSEMWVAPGQTPADVTIQSMYLYTDGSCTAQVSTIQAWSVTSTDTLTSGVPTSVGDYQLTSP